MIFVLDASVDDLADLPEEEAENLFTLLLDSDRSGRHLVVIERSVCRWGIASLSLSGQNINHLSGLLEQFTTRGNIHRCANSYLKIKLGNSGVELFDNCFQIGHTEFCLGEYSTSKTKMIVENLNNDRNLYEFMFGVAVKQTDVPGVAVDFVLGGGDTTVTAFEGEIDSHRVSVCVVDSDRCSPCDRLGGTAKKVVRTHRKRNLLPNDPSPAYVGIALETVGHELENYIPFCSVKLIECFDYSDILNSIVSQETLEDAQDCFWLYFDIKKGLDGALIREKVSKSLMPTSVSDWICKKTGLADDELESFKISGISGKVVEHFLRHDVAKERFTEFCKTEYWKSLFLRHFEQLLWFFAAPQVRRS